MFSLTLVSSHPGLLIALGVLLLSLGTWFYTLISWKSSQKSFPTVGKHGILDFRLAMREGNNKYPERPFIIPFQDPTVILPHSSLEAIKNLPDSDLSTNGNMYRRFAIRWTGSGWVDPELHASIKVDLSHDTNSIIPLVQNEIEYSAAEHVGKCAEWTSVQIQASMTQVVTLVTGRVFLGLPLSRDPRWVDASMQHTMSVLMYSSRLRTFPSIVRPLVARLLPEFSTVARTKVVISSLLDKIIQAKLRSSNSDKEFEKVNAATEASVTEDSKMISWLMKRYEAARGPNYNSSLIIRDHLTLCFAATGFPSIAITHAIIDLAAYPQYFQPLRAEIDTELRASSDGTLDAKALAKCSLLDSFVKESARMNPPGIVAWLRMTHKPLRLSTDDVIPADTLIAYCDPRFNDTLKTFNDTDIFDGERYVKLRARSNEGAPCAYSSTSGDDLTFGYGAHACPGRVFASAEVKLILAHLIMKYDFKLGDGSSQGRPENLFMDFMIMPPPVNVAFKAR